MAGHMLNLAVLGSGRGSNFQAILNAIIDGRIPDARVVCVISNNSGAGILATAREHSIPAFHCSLKQFPSESAFAGTLLQILQSHHTDLVLLAGYMKLIPTSILTSFSQRIINIHPALLPKFGGRGMYGLHVHEAVIAGGETESGATVHYVDEAYDHGSVILQKRVPVYPSDTPEKLAQRVLKVEHEIYPEVVRQFATGEIPLKQPFHATAHP
jgi:phosphoribosylglycinamide formyltransferase-1